MVAQRFRRSDGVLGVGFEIEFGGLPQLSIAWPDGPATRHTLTEAQRLKIEISDLPEDDHANSEPTSPPEPNAPASPAEDLSEADAIRTYLAENPQATNKSVVAALKKHGIEITSSQVSRYRSELKS